MSTEKRLKLSKEIKEMSLWWNLSMRETMEEMLCHYYESTPVAWEQIATEIEPLTDEELFNKLCEL
jgi:hypothetical protein